ncbi:zinc finger protein 436 isoform X2 [Bicyclus anynana]|uniref:Zinc finger protein 436 isoform X2 n=1 Tax=Bicyclus anynana TaxID=110368 RepID=A0A6J1MQJ0_BICAN|nr:zinc finger protein 436 isoform X2 [Bicyclus anynana]
MMRCFVPFCGNTSDNVSTSGKDRITFHGLPSEVHLRAAWLRALGKQDNHLPNPAVVCSQHFIDDDFCDAESCARQLCSDAIPSTLLLFQLCRGGNLKQTLCVLCAQRLKNFSRFRDLSLRAHSLMTDIFDQHKAITKQHKAAMYHATKQLKCSFTRTTLAADHCDLYIDHTDEEEQTAEESVVTDVATVAIKDDCSDSISITDNMDDRFNNDCPSNEEYSDMEIKSEARLDETLNRKDLCDASQVLEPRAAESCDQLELDKTGVQKLNDVPPPSGSSAQASVAPLSARLATNKKNRVQATEVTADTQKSEQTLETDIGELGNLSSQSGSTLYTDTSILTNCVVQLGDILHKPNIAVLDDMAHMSTFSVKKSYSCDMCSYKSTRKEHFLNHIFTHTGQMPYSCNMCYYQCSQRVNLLKHMRSHTGEKPYSCQICEHKFAQKSHLTKHIKTHTGEKPHACSMCNFKCADKSSLLRHTRTHTGEKPYSCDICKHKFAQKRDLLQHTRTHTGEKPYCCNVCSYKCTGASSLSRHLKTHTGEKPHTCDICNRKFLRISQLSCHMKIHSGEQPYSCKMCNYKCSIKSYLLSHMRTHTGEKPYSCDMCNYKTAVNSNLLVHKRNHTGEKPYSCDMCSYKAIQKVNLSKHMKYHTGENSKKN